MRYILNVVSADSDPPIPTRGECIQQESDNLAELLVKGDEWVAKWLSEGYQLTPAGIFVNGSLWHNAYIVDREQPGRIYKVKS